jgi:ethanolamine transporter
MPLLLMIKNTWPLLILSLLLLCCLVYFTQKTVSFFSVLAILIRAAALTGFSIAILQEAAGIVILEGLTPLDEIYPVIVRIGVFLGGILPFFTVLQKALQRPLIRLSRRIGISLTGVSYLFLSTANDIPTLLNLDIMDENSIMLNVAYAMITAYTVGDFLAFTLTFAPHLAIPMMLGRLLCGLLIIMICLCVIRKTPAHIDSNKAEQAG